MPFVRHATEVEYIRHKRKTLRTDILSESYVVDLSCCDSPHPFSSFDLTWGWIFGVETQIWKRDRD